MGALFRRGVAIVARLAAREGCPIATRFGDDPLAPVKDAHAVQNSQSEPARSLQSKSRCRTDQTVLAPRNVRPMDAYALHKTRDDQDTKAHRRSTYVRRS